MDVFRDRMMDEGASLPKELGGMLATIDELERMEKEQRGIRTQEKRMYKEEKLRYVVLSNCHPFFDFAPPLSSPPHDRLF